jgi:predicted Co/Zn/Cd cation transporter (cation efflux family)
LLDGLFNLTYFATGLFTVKVASLVAGGDDERFPHGYAFFEPLVNGIKGMLVLGVSIMALVGSLQALLSGGRTIAAGMAIAYGVFATVVCWSLALVMKRGVKTTDSPLVEADAENWLVNAAISSCVLLAFAGIFLLKAMGLDRLAPYVDPIVVLTVVAISIAVPVRMAWNALMALMNRAPSHRIIEQVTEIVESSIADLPVQERFIRVIQPGRQRMVLVHLVLPADYALERLSNLDAIRMKTFLALREAHVATFVDILFTTDRQWGAPLSDGGFVGLPT